MSKIGSNQIKPTNDQMMIIAGHIKQLRIKVGWNQAKVAASLKISVAAYSKIENGITDLNVSRLAQIAKLYNVSILELLANGNADFKVENTVEINLLREKIAKQDEEIFKLQKRVIELYEEIRTKS